MARASAMAAAGALLLCAVPTLADEPAPSRLDSAAVAAFANEFMPAAMARRHIPGLVFVFVNGGEVGVAEGFGFADLETHRRVDAEQTVFRLASVSKTITATAAMQLVEQGRLDLGRDINEYLHGFRVGQDRGAITLHHLLTHTAGFDERLTGVFARSQEDVQPLAQYLAASMPPTFTAPGRIVSYSNHGFGVIGLLVEATSERPFAEYVREQIFEPLGMMRSGCATSRAPPEAAVAYDDANGRHRAVSPEYVQLSPAGGCFTTGTDMARFLVAHLRGGAAGSGRILKPETVALMHAQHVAQAPAGSGWAYGMWEDVRDGERALLHNGGGKGYRALICLLPGRDAGFFIAYNLADRDPAEGELQEAFITGFRRRFLASGASVEPHGYATLPAAQAVGEYMYVRRARTTAERFVSAANRVRVARGPGAALVLTGASGSASLTPSGPMLFRRSDGHGMVGFDGIVSNRAQRLIVINDSGFPAVYERLPTIETLPAQLTWLAVMVSAFLYAAAWRPVAALVRRRRLARSDRRQLFWPFAGVASALNFAFLVAFPVTFIGRIEGGVPQFVYGTSALTEILLLIPRMTAAMAAASALLVVRVVIGAEAGRWRAAAAPGMVAAALLSFTWFAVQWRLMIAP